MGFSAFKLDERIHAALKRLNFTVPTPIQSGAIPQLLEGKDMVGTARTGTGKTLAFVLPMLNHLLNNKPRTHGRPRALVLAPTRELAQQIHDALTKLLPGLGLRAATIYGGVGMRPQEDALRRGVEILVACPGRLLDHMRQGHADLRFLEILVLDEADQMFDMGFLPNIRMILSRVPAERQTMLFSATFASEVQQFIKEVCKDPVRVNVASDQPAQTVAHAIYPVASHLKVDLLLKIIETEKEGTILVFTRTKHRANRIAEKLEKIGIIAGILHSNKSQSQRQKALDGFRSGKIRILVATDIAARGIDVADITHVINFDIPESSTTYIHRIGRTGRAEKTGDALTLVAPDDGQILRDIERALGKPIERLTMEGFDYKASAPPREPGQSNNGGMGSERRGRPPQRPRSSVGSGGYQGRSSSGSSSGRSSGGGSSGGSSRGYRGGSGGSSSGPRSSGSGGRGRRDGGSSSGGAGSGGGSGPSSGGGGGFNGQKLRF